MTSSMAQPQASARKIGPSRWFHLVGVALIAAGIFGGAKGMISFVHALATGLTRAVFPGETDVTFATPGIYKIYYESNSVFNGRVFDTQQRVPDLELHVTNTATGETIPLREPGYSESYNLNGSTGRMVFLFQIREPGRYTVAAHYRDSAQHEEAVFAIGNVHLFRAILTMFGAVGCVLIFGTAGVALIALIEVRRSAAKRRLQGQP